ncbi:MAG: MotA/TolQ/ExbB proton channel family protein [Nitrospira sp.]|nr:MotA/TolQ/ExbB proton channel family protein [Nitrospira sp.]
MDIATIIGIVGGLALIIGSILIDSTLSAFINFPGLLIVVGGTIMATLIMQKMSVVLGAFSVAMNAFTDKTESPEVRIKQIVSLSAKARKGGLLALEKERMDNAFLKKGVTMAVDGIDPQDIINTMNVEIDSLITRHEVGQKVFKFMGSTAPAMGMIGTLIGLVAMLRSLSDPAAIGPAMAVAMLTTFYGAVLAFMIFNPIAEKLEDRTRQEEILLNIIVTGIEGISKGSNQHILKGRLVAFLDPKARKAGIGES